MKIEQALTGQKVWGWELAGYLFLAGVGAGAYLLGFILELIDTSLVPITRFTVVLSAPVVILGTIFLILDLGRKNLFFLAGARPASSWIARGTIIISVFILLDLLYIAGWVWPLNWLETMPGLRLTLASIITLFSVLTLIYTGLVLGAARPITFWKTGLLPLLFLLSGLSTGVMAAILYSAIAGLSTGISTEPSLKILAYADVVIIILETATTAVYLIRMSNIREADMSMHNVLKGRYAPHFWVGVVFAALVLPFAFAVYHALLTGETGAFTLVTTIVYSVIGLIGGFSLRYVIVAGGTFMPIDVMGTPVPDQTN